MKRTKKILVESSDGDDSVQLTVEFWRRNAFEKEAEEDFRRMLSSLHDAMRRHYHAVNISFK
jgi:hypothetical protein